MIEDSNVTSTERRERMETIVSRISRIPRTEFADDVLIREELGIDSLMAMEIVATLEREFDIEINEAEMYDISTIGEFVAFVDQRCRERHAS